MGGVRISQMILLVSISMRKAHHETKIKRRDEWEKTFLNH